MQKCIGIQFNTLHHHNKKTIYFVLLFQNGIPIYNLATGTCLGAQSANKNTHITMDLCYKNDKSTITWDLVRSKLPLKSVR